MGHLSANPVRCHFFGQPSIVLKAALAVGPSLLDRPFAIHKDRLIPPSAILPILSREVRDGVFRLS